MAVLLGDRGDKAGPKAELPSAKILKSEASLSAPLSLDFVSLNVASGDGLKN